VHPHTISDGTTRHSEHIARWQVEMMYLEIGGKLGYASREEVDPARDLGVIAAVGTVLLHTHDTRRQGRHDQRLLERNERPWYLEQGHSRQEHVADALSDKGRRFEHHCLQILCEVVVLAVSACGVFPLEAPRTFSRSLWWLSNSGMLEKILGACCFVSRPRDSRPCMNTRTMMSRSLRTRRSG
jgi:hypothetical protein